MKLTAVIIKSMKIIISHKYWIVLTSTFFFIQSCKDKVQDTNLSGKQLAEIYCVSCHALPSPKELDKKTWENHVLPRMSYFLGLRDFIGDEKDVFEDTKEGKKEAENSPYFRNKEALISHNDWEKVQDYFIQNAPQILDTPFYAKTQSLNAWFEVRIPMQGFSPPGTSLVKFSKSGNILVGDMHKELLMQFNANLELQKKDHVGTAPVQFQETATDYWLLVMGDFLGTDEPTGKLIQYPKTGKTKKNMALEKLKRPVDFLVENVDQDQEEEIIICEFGKYTGGLVMFKKEKSSYRKIYLSKRPGAVKIEKVDWNLDGLLDFVVLYGQAEEGLYYYENQGNGKFKELKLIGFPATYGSSHFCLEDINGDGKLDIIYTNGDNADYPPILKSYHGVRVFLQKENLRFHEQFFLPLNGAYKSLVGDFNLDGLKDIVTISYFPDYKNAPEQYFTVFKGLKNGSYEPFVWNNTNYGRFATIDASDVDKDGDLDLLLGSISAEVTPQEFSHFQETWDQNGIPFLLLLNNTVKK